ncbi:MAG: hypothetical protein KIT63_13380 [Rhodoferax sp.]|nr:hypothetical protein [Rhodoferax sp.]
MTRQRVDWERIIADLIRSGFTITDIVQATGIPHTTLLGYRNLGAEPRHWAGETLLQLWRDRTHPHVPVREVMPKVPRVQRQRSDLSFKHLFDTVTQKWPVATSKDRRLDVVK